MVADNCLSFLFQERSPWQNGRAEGASGSTVTRDEREPVMGLGKKAKGKAKELKGKTKKNAGKATGNRRLQTKGKADELTGKLKLKGQKAKSAVKK